MPYNIMGAAAENEQGATTQTINLDDDFHQVILVVLFVQHETSFLQTAALFLLLLLFLLFR